MFDAIQFSTVSGVVILLAFAAVYLGSSYLYQLEK